MNELRKTVLNDLLGKPWVANAKGPDAFDCYSLTRLVQEKLFGRNNFPDIEVPNHLTWRFIVEQIAEWKDKLGWHEVCDGRGLITAQDGALVAMGATLRSAHIGTWFKQEGCILHTDNPDGVMFQPLTTVKAYGWHNLRFYDPA